MSIRKSAGLFALGSMFLPGAAQYLLREKQHMPRLWKCSPLRNLVPFKIIYCVRLSRSSAIPFSSTKPDQDTATRGTLQDEVMSKEDRPLMQLRPQEQQRLLKAFYSSRACQMLYKQQRKWKKNQLFIPEVNPESCVEWPSCQVPVLPVAMLAMV